MSNQVYSNKYSPYTSAYVQNSYNINPSSILVSSDSAQFIGAWDGVANNRTDFVEESSGTFTFKENDTYVIEYTLGLNSTEDMNVALFFTDSKTGDYRHGVQYLRSVYRGAAPGLDYACLSISVVRNMRAGDFIRFYASQRSTGSKSHRSINDLTDYTNVRIAKL